MTVAELEETMSMDEFAEWLILESIEPYGERAAWLRAGFTFDYYTGIEVPNKNKTLTSGRRELPKQKAAEEMNKAMYALMLEYPGRIRIRPKKTN